MFGNRLAVRDGALRPSLERPFVSDTADEGYGSGRKKVPLTLSGIVVFSASFGWIAGYIPRGGLLFESQLIALCPAIITLGKVKLLRPMQFGADPSAT